MLEVIFKDELYFWDRALYAAISEVAHILEVKIRSDKSNWIRFEELNEIYEPKYLAVPLKVVMKFDAIFIDHGPINGEVAMHLITRGIAI